MRRGGEPQSSYGHIVKVILHFHSLVGELMLHWFPSNFPGFRFNFLHSCPEIDFCHVDSFITKSCVFLLVNLILAAYVFFTCGSMTTFVMILINSSSSCHMIQTGFDHIFQFHYVFLLPSPNSQQQVMVYVA